MKKHPKKFGALFAAIFLILIIIGIVIGFIKNKNNSTPLTEKQIVQNKLQIIIPLFNLSTTETFNNTLVFNKTNDIIYNLKSFFDFAFPKLNYDELNKILKENNVNLTAFEIFEKHKNDDIKNNLDKYAILAQGDMSPLYISYISSRLNLSDIDDAKNMIKLMFIISTMTKFLFYNDFNDTPTTLKYVINKDYLTNDVINIYLKTKLNESVDYKDAIDYNEYVSICYMNSQLCKKSINVNGLIDLLKIRTTYETKILTNDIFYISMAKFLMDLENIDTTHMYDIYIKLSQKLNQLYQTLQRANNNSVKQLLSGTSMPTFPDVTMQSDALSQLDSISQLFPEITTDVIN